MKTSRLLLAAILMLSFASCARMQIQDDYDRRLAQIEERYDQSKAGAVTPAQHEEVEAWHEEQLTRLEQWRKDRLKKQEELEALTRAGLPHKDTQFRDPRMSPPSIDNPYNNSYTNPQAPYH